MQHKTQFSIFMGYSNIELNTKHVNETTMDPFELKKKKKWEMKICKNKYIQIPYHVFQNMEKQKKWRNEETNN